MRSLRAERLLPFARFKAEAASPATLLLDARSESAFREGHIRGAVNLPFPDFNAESLAETVGPNVHRRILIMRDDGSELRGEDLLLPVGRKGKRGKVPFAIRFHVGPGVELGLADGGKGAGLALPDGTYWQFVAGAGALEGGELTIKESLWVDGGGKPHPIQQLVLQGMVSRGGGSFSWLLKKMG